jgi:hypothetical protein
MKTIVFSLDAESGLSECQLGFRERDELFEQLHSSIEFISRTNFTEHRQFSINIDAMLIVLDLEISSTTILVAQVHTFFQRC